MTKGDIRLTFWTHTLLILPVQPQPHKLMSDHLIAQTGDWDDKKYTVSYTLPFCVPWQERSYTFTFAATHKIDVLSFSCLDVIDFGDWTANGKIHSQIVQERFEASRHVDCWSCFLVGREHLWKRQQWITDTEGLLTSLCCLPWTSCM